MPKNLFVLHNVTDFAPGAFENVVVGNGSIQLAKAGNEHLASGCYTSPAFFTDNFLKCVSSWNADTPPGTSVEVQTRISASGRWSKWFSYGRWSPFVKRETLGKMKDEIAVCDGEFLQVLNEEKPASIAQIRIFLYTNSPNVSPHVHLLSMAVKPIQAKQAALVRTNRKLHMPAYSCLVRDPSIAGRIAVPTALAMLMNRWGEDVLPEEVARAMYDHATGRFGNLAYVGAGAGMYGYSCYANFCGLDVPRAEIKHGNAVLAQVNYRAPALAETEEAEIDERHAKLPVLEGAAADSYGHLVVIYGFVWHDGEEWVRFNDPLAPTNLATSKEMPAAMFANIYTGLCFLFSKGPKTAGAAKPMRILTQVTIEDDIANISSHGEILEPGINVPGKTSKSTICYTLSDGSVYASAAQKKFYYVSLDESKIIHIDSSVTSGRRMTLYLIGSRGATWVAEKVGPQLQLKQETESENC